MIVYLKMCPNIFDKIRLKSVRGNFIPICGMWSGEGRGDFLAGVLSNRKNK